MFAFLPYPEESSPNKLVSVSGFACSFCIISCFHSCEASHGTLVRNGIGTNVTPCNNAPDPKSASKKRSGLRRRTRTVAGLSRCGAFRTLACISAVKKTNAIIRKERVCSVSSDNLNINCMILYVKTIQKRKKTYESH